MWIKIVDIEIANWIVSATGSEFVFNEGTSSIVDFSDEGFGSIVEVENLWLGLIFAWSCNMHIYMSKHLPSFNYGKVIKVIKRTEYPVLHNPITHDTGSMSSCCSQSYQFMTYSVIYLTIQ